MATISTQFLRSVRMYSRRSMDPSQSCDHDGAPSHQRLSIHAAKQRDEDSDTGPLEMGGHPPVLLPHLPSRPHGVRHRRPAHGMRSAAPSPREASSLGLLGVQRGEVYPAKRASRRRASSTEEATASRNRDHLNSA